MQQLKTGGNRLEKMNSIPYPGLLFSFVAIIIISFFLENGKDEGVRYEIFYGAIFCRKKIALSLDKLN